MRTHPFIRLYILVSSTLILAGLMVALIFISAAHAAGETFWVNSSGDGGDSSLGDCTCATSGGVCTLRAAIQEANTCAGGQTIRFNSGITMTLVPATALPTITDDYTIIDGSDQWYDWSGTLVPGVVIDGASLGASGLTIEASNCAIYGIQVINFSSHGINIINVAENNHIGGEGVNQRNIISRNGQNGVRIYGANAKNNIVSSNYVGTNNKGFYELSGGNGHHGISVWYGEGNIITGNLIADNGWSGATMDAVSNGMINNNRIGMDVNGNPLPNVYYGIHIANAAMPQVSENKIAFNRRGILVEGGSQAFIDDNDIYSNNATGLGVPDGGGVLISGAGSHADLYHNKILSNTALFGGGVAIKNGANGVVDHNTIQENQAVITTTGSLGGGGIYVDAASITATYNIVLTNTAIGPTSSPYGFPDGGGVFLNNASDAWLIGNEIRGNNVTGNAGGGGGVRIIGGGNIHLNNNVILNNSSNTASYDGSAIDINTLMGATRVFMERNQIEENSSSNSAIFIFNSDYVTLTNNLIVKNHDPGLYLMDSGSHIQSNFNTIALNSGSGIVLHDSHLDLFNTLVISNTSYGMDLSGSSNMYSTRNDVWGNSLGGSNPSSSFYLETDPLFFNADLGEFALRPASPCLDVGDYGHPVSTSFNGIPRPQGISYDLGAYEMPLPTWLPVVLR